MATPFLPAKDCLIYQWLKVLKEVNCHYQYDDKLPEFDEVKSRMQSANDALLNDAECILMMRL